MRRTSIKALIVSTFVLVTIAFSGCYRKPDLFLYDYEGPEIGLPVVEIELETYWDYGANLGIDYDWRAEWFYGWDDEDRRLFGDLGYTEPDKFLIRRYYTGSEPLGKRLYRLIDYQEGKRYRRDYDLGYWDLLVWNQVQTLDGVQSLRTNESQTDIDKEITVTTGPTINSVRYHVPRYQTSFYEPEQLFSALDHFEISPELSDFYYSEEEGLWLRKILLEPITYIYLPQVILHNNRGRISQVPGTANLSGMANSTSINTGITGMDAVAVNFSMRLKNEKTFKGGEIVDIVGGRLMTFGICGQNANRISRADDMEEMDPQHHYLDVNMQFYNGMDSTFVFDVTDQVRAHFKGGVITVELDIDTVPIPQRPGGSGFDAVVKDFEDAGTWEFNM